MICEYLGARIGLKGEKERWFRLATSLLLLVVNPLFTDSWESTCWNIGCFLCKLLFEILYKHYHRQIQN